MKEGHSLVSHIKRLETTTKAEYALESFFWPDFTHNFQLGKVSTSWGQSAWLDDIKKKLFI